MSTRCEDLASLHGRYPTGWFIAWTTRMNPLCGAAVTPLYLVEWEWDQLNDLMQCPVCATLAQTGL